MTKPHGIDYRIGDFNEIATEFEGQAAVVHLDSPWAAPARHGGRGVNYQTYPVTEDALDDFTNAELDTEAINPNRFISEMIDSAMKCLEPGGWLIMDGDSYAAPRFEQYLREEYGEARINDEFGRPYRGGGLRKTGRVCYHSKDGTPDKSTTGKYGVEAGYPVVFGHKGETDRELRKSIWQPARHPRHTEPTNEYPQGTVKPIAPYKVWVNALAESGELVIDACAGSGPMLLAVEELWGDQARAIGCDINESSKEAYKTRRSEITKAQHQQTLGSVMSPE